MPKTKLRAAIIGGTADAIEMQFYEAMQLGDIEKYMACWADEDEIVCVERDGARHIGSARIRAAMTTQLTNGVLAVRVAHVCKVESLTSAMHSVIEYIQKVGADGAQEQVMVATHVYQRSAQGWRLVARHASPCQNVTAQATSFASQVLH